MKRLIFATTENGGTVSEGFPLITTQPWGDTVTPYILLGYWYKQNLGNDRWRWEHTGEIVNVEQGTPLSVENGNVVAKVGEFRRETSGLWLRTGEGVERDETLVWFKHCSPAHYFTSGDRPKITDRFVTENCNIHYCENGDHLLADVGVGSVITVNETRSVRKAGTGKQFFNFSKFEDVSRTVHTLRVDGLSIAELRNAMTRGRANFPVDIEMYTLLGKRERITVPSTISADELKQTVRAKNFSRYSEVVD